MSLITLKNWDRSYPFYMWRVSQVLPFTRRAKPICCCWRALKDSNLMPKHNHSNIETPCRNTKTESGCWPHSGVGVSWMSSMFIMLLHLPKLHTPTTPDMTNCYETPFNWAGRHIPPHQASQGWVVETVICTIVFHVLQAWKSRNFWFSNVCCPSHLNPTPNCCRPDQLPVA